MVGWELGNEPDLHIDGKQFTAQLLARDYATFVKEALPTAYESTGAGTTSSPYAMGADITHGAYLNKPWARDFYSNLTELGVCLDVASGRRRDGQLLSLIVIVCTFVDHLS